MTIFFVTNNYTPYAGGVVHSIDALANALRKQDHIVYIITLDFLGNRIKENEYIIRLPCTFRFQYKKNYMAVPLLPAHQLKRLALRLKPDIMHVHHPFLLGAAALRVAKKMDIPIMFTYHTQYEQYLHYVPMPQQITKPVTQKVVQKFCNAVDGIIAPTKTIAKQLTQKGITTPITVIPSPIDDMFFPVIKTSMGMPKNKIRLLSVSRFVKEKNIPFLLRVMKKLDPQQFHLTLCGYGAETESLQNCAYNELGLSPDTVQFIIKPNRSALLELYKFADLFIFASKTETQGLVLAEAMACGLPVVALDAPGARDIIENGVNGFLVDSEEQMKEKIEQLVSNLFQYQKIKQATCKTALGYQSALVGSKIVELYTSKYFESKKFLTRF